VLSPVPANARCDNEEEVAWSTDTDLRLAHFLAYVPTSAPFMLYTDRRARDGDVERAGAGPSDGEEATASALAPWPLAEACVGIAMGDDGVAAGRDGCHGTGGNSGSAASSAPRGLAISPPPPPPPPPAPAAKALPGDERLPTAIVNMGHASDVPSLDDEPHDGPLPLRAR